MNTRLLFTFSLLAIFVFTLKSYAWNNDMSNNLALKKITISDPEQKLVLQLDYSNGYKITQLNVKGKNVLSESGIFTGFSTKGGLFNSTVSAKEVKVEKSDNKIFIRNIIYGDQSINVNELWSFELG